MPDNITIEVRTTCPTCGGGPYHWDDCPAHPAWETRFDCDCGGKCPTCDAAGTVVDAERSQWLRTVAEWVAKPARSKWCPECVLWDAHAPDCPHELAKAVLA